MQDCYLAYYLTELAGATFMIFTRTCDNTRKMALMLRNLGFDAIPIHGQMAQAKRIGALNKFKAGERSILVATGRRPAHPFRCLSPAWKRLDCVSVVHDIEKHVGIVGLAFTELLQLLVSLRCVLL